MVGVYSGANEEMKIKVGSTTYSDEDQPIMVILTKEDKLNISRMAEDTMRYASYPGGHGLTEKQMLEWMMGDGNEPDS